MNIAFCINKIGMIGLASTLTSLIRNCSNSHELKIWFLCAYLTPKEKNSIVSILYNDEYRGAVEFIDTDPESEFKAFRSLHGDYTTYCRLLLPELLPHDQVLYLDSDLLIELDVLALKDFDFKGKAIGAVYGCKIKDALENRFYMNEMAIAPDSASFNAGVLFLNLKAWREAGIKEKCYEVGYAHSSELLSCDQTMLNALFADDFAELPAAFNCVWLPNASRPVTADRMILHFVGSPKPWDPFGPLIHKAYSTWSRYRVGNGLHSPSSIYSIANLKRAWNIRRSYGRTIRERMRSDRTS